MTFSDYSYTQKLKEQAQLARIEIEERKHNEKIEDLVNFDFSLKNPTIRVFALAIILMITIVIVKRL